jgi:hypothetical protein
VKQIVGVAPRLGLRQRCTQDSKSIVEEQLLKEFRLSGLFP